MNFKKFTSWLLTLVMIVSLLPMAAFAEETTGTGEGSTPTVTPYIYMDPNDGEDKKSPIESSLVTSVGGSYSIEFWTQDIKITAVTASAVEGVTIEEQLEGVPGRFDVLFTAAGEYALVFNVTVNGTKIPVIINADVSENQSSDGDEGGEPTPAETIGTINYSATGADGTWTQVEEIFIDHAEGNTGYIRIFDNNMNIISLSEDLKCDYSGDLFKITKDTEKLALKITLADKNGDAEFNFTYKGSRKELCLYVRGYVDPSTLTYGAAVVEKAELGAGTVTFDGTVTGTLSDEDKAEGFALSEDGTLTYTKTAETKAGSYEAAVGDKLYIVAIFPEISAMTGENALKPSDYYVTVNPDTDSMVEKYITNGGVSNLEDGYHMFTVNGDEVWCDGDNDFGLDKNGNYTPIYFVKVSGKQLTDLTEGYKIYPDQAMMGKTSYLIAHERVKLNGINAIKVYPRYDASETAVNDGYVIRHEDGTAVSKNTYILAGFTLVDENGLAISDTDKPVMASAAHLDKTAPNDVHITEDVTRKGGDLDLWTSVGDSGNIPDTFYFADNSIEGSSHAILFNKIDISSIRVQSTNEENVKITEFVTTDDNGNNVIGFKLDRKNLDKFYSELLKVTFDYDGEEKVIYIPVVNRDKEEQVSIQIGKDDLANKTLQEIYDTFVGSVLYIEAGEYEEDLCMNRNNVKVEGVAKEEGGSRLVVLKGSADTSKPILELDSYGQVFMSNIAIDGSKWVDNGNPTKIGLQTSEKTQMVNFSGIENQVGVKYIKNCATGLNVKNSNVILNLSSVTLENNTVAVQANCHININGNIFKNNGTAIKLVTERSEGIPRITVKENNFIGNTTDFEIGYLSSTSASVTQNYFDGNKPVIVKDSRDNVYWAPYYTDETRTVLSATLEGAENASVTRDTATAYKLPVTLEYNDVTTFDSNVFKEINVAIGNITASVPVTEVVENKLVVTTEWNFDKETLLATDELPASMNLKVTDELSTDAQDIVNAAVADQTAIVQKVNFTHSGILPGKATVKIMKTSDITDVTDLKLYYVDETNKEVVDLAICDVTEVTENGVTYFVVTVDHCSEYIIAAGNIVIENPFDSTGDGEDGSTGDGSTSEDGTGSSSDSSSNKKDDDDDDEDEAPAATATPAPAAPATSTTTPSANDFVSAQDVENKLANTTGDTATFDVTDKELISSKAFEVLAENPGKFLVFETDSYRWTFASDDITDAGAIAGTSFKPAISLDSPNVDAIKALAGDAAENFTHIYFEHHGKLPGKAKVEIFVGEAQAGMTKYVYHYIPERNGFEYIETITLTEKGWAAFEIYGCSDYILSDVMLDESLVLEAEAETPVQPQEPAVDSTVEEPAGAQTGMGMLPIIVVIAIIAVCVIFFIIKKKKAE